MCEGGSSINRSRCEIIADPLNRQNNGEILLTEDIGKKVIRISNYQLDDKRAQLTETS